MDARMTSIYQKFQLSHFHIKIIFLFLVFRHTKDFNMSENKDKLTELKNEFTQLTSNIRIRVEDRFTFEAFTTSPWNRIDSFLSRYNVDFCSLGQFEDLWNRLQSIYNQVDGLKSIKFDNRNLFNTCRIHSLPGPFGTHLFHC